MLFQCVNMPATHDILHCYCAVRSDCLLTISVQETIFLYSVLNCKPKHSIYLDQVPTWPVITGFRPEHDDPTGRIFPVRVRNVLPSIFPPYLFLPACPPEPEPHQKCIVWVSVENVEYFKTERSLDQTNLYRRFLQLNFTQQVNISDSFTVKTETMSRTFKSEVLQ